MRTRLSLAAAAVGALVGALAPMASASATGPDVPSGLFTSPSSGADCGTSAPYTTIDNTDISLRGTFSDPAGGVLSAHFKIWPTGYGTGADVADTTISVVSGSVGTLVVPRSVITQLLATDGITGNGTFSWTARIEHGSLASDWSAECHFVFDGVRPTPPSAVSPQFPDGSNGWPANTGQARTPGTFTLSSGGVSDVVAYAYSTGWDPTVRTVTTTAGASVDVTLTPPSSGSWTLTVYTLDAGGNRSDSFIYRFYANA
ncbi:hypothetical protein NMG29_30595 [Streptomyces cocklensis]|uniref:Uncharacterized protein n=1 Tax=Actinacidiphila cocklensis TaxID=887465 RepID=A0A9W4GQV1_9ACTN|nr:hypothetical protein [Actinacidiphila cocklensis]MDD1062512.1 hypothetical protein [Actinacidiphila cocklensis]CAG6391946.1 exported hypothetical protein [Actinacidiphila cocklensis]